MRRPALLVLALGLSLASAGSANAMMGALPATDATRPIVKVGYYCSPGFVASYGRCIATASNDEVDLYLNDPAGYDQAEAAPPPVVRRHRRHRLSERY